MATQLNTSETLVARVLADAAARTGLPLESVALLSSEAVTWPDGSLGCPRPGMVYTQALVQGHRIRVRAGTTELDYHATSRGHFIVCPSGQAVDPRSDERM